MFTQEDRASIEAHGLSVKEVETQLARFVSGFPWLDIVAPAGVRNGISVLGPERLAETGALYDGRRDSLRIVKFVPASGAATRMFKSLYSFIGDGRADAVVEKTLGGLNRFGFWPLLEKTLPEGADPVTVARHIVGRPGLGYGDSPKALIAFHRYGTELRTALEEHFVEGAGYAASRGRVRLHFTVSSEHRAGFADLVARVKAEYERRYGVEYEIEMSEQRSSTDTIAAAPDNTPFRDGEGRLLFRPAGHGALIANLGDLDADVVFIKNIDNVTTDDRRGDTLAYKKALGGVLLEARDRIFDALARLEEHPSDEEAASAAALVRSTLCISLPEGFDARPLPERVRMLRRLLDRPLRVCGMVRNEGEPGGGPFFVRDTDGVVSLQILESSQIAPGDRGMMEGATHFNPVDLVCSLRDRHGRKYDLSRFVDETTGFISEKSKDGRPLRALELPGLWNGAMARWNTIFVEVPVSTFTPVKTVADLLRAEHIPVCG